MVRPIDACRALLPLALLLPVCASAATLGPAASYNLFVLGDATLTPLNTSNSDSQGNIAVGGQAGVNPTPDAQFMNYSVASGIAGNPGADPNPARLVVGGDLVATNGGVGQGQNGAIYVDGTATLTSFTATGGVNPGGVTASDLVDFDAAKQLFEYASQQLSLFGVTGTAAAQFSTLTFTGSSSGLNVFNINASLLNSTNTVVINVPTGATVLINVSGTQATFQNGQVMLSNGLTESRVLYNFYQATTLNLPGSKNPQGSVLAPFAHTIGGFGSFDGQLITNSFSGHTEFHSRDGGSGPSTYFNGDLVLPTLVPLPAGVWLLLSGGAALACLGRRKQQH